MNQLAATLGINRKRVYNGLERIKVNFHLVSHAHFHHFMISGPTFNPRLTRPCQLYAMGKACPTAAGRVAHGGKTFILFEQDSQIVLILACNIQAYSFTTSGRKALYQTPD
ncbi:hypothetical protein LNP17_17530 [Klebsiella variicola subsp. variicola]|nr:hypothetical protein [Klebsiella variicola subsp. variicola]